MRGLGHSDTTTTSLRGTTALLACLTVLLTGCGDTDTQPQGNTTSPTTSASPTSPSTPAILRGGTTVTGPAFTFTVAPRYELYSKHNPDAPSHSWLRGYSWHFARFTVAYAPAQYLPLEEELEITRNYLVSRGSNRIKRLDDLTLLGHPTAHLVGRDANLTVHAYVVQLGDHYLEINVERKPGDSEQKRLQQAMIDSIRLTG